MIRHIYIEKAVANEQMTRSLCARFPAARQTLIESFGEIFNARAQNFRLQKKQPAAILAKKYGRLVLPIPDALSMGEPHNYYFSHAYNCLYDCSYCFLQTLYSSAHYVFFVNHQDFAKAIIDKAAEVYPAKVCFFSGYDCDSLAFEPITGFSASFVELFRGIDNAILELRTKSTAIQSLLATEPCDNIVIAFSLLPEELASQYDRKTPSISRRLNAIERLANRGWQIGFRFDPLMWHKDFSMLYDRLLQQLASVVPEQQRHSVSLGCLRFPKQQYKRITELRPEEPWLAGVDIHHDIASYPENKSEELITSLKRILNGFIAKDKIFTMT